MPLPRRYTRSSTTMTVSMFFEQLSLNKFNFNPSYQREGDIWDEKSQAFLIDTIFKNFPMPPIFLEQKIKNGVTNFDVIDGKQRLSAIQKFIQGTLALPKNFSEDEYGYAPLNGKTFEQIKILAESDTIAEAYLDTFWSYKIGIEYIEKPDDNIVRSIFDRLNRNGARLNFAELRKARFSETLIYKTIEEIAHSTTANRVLNTEKDKRQRSVNFWTDVFVFIDEGKICGGGAKYLESKMYELTMASEEYINLLKNTVETTINLFLKWDIDIIKYDIAKETHLYVLLYLAYKASLDNKIDFYILGRKINEFYKVLRSFGNNKIENQFMKAYFDSTQSGSKSVKAREARYLALSQALGLDIAGQND